MPTYLYLYIYIHIYIYMCVVILFYFCMWHGPGWIQKQLCCTMLHLFAWWCVLTLNFWMFWSTYQSQASPDATLAGPPCKSSAHWTIWTPLWIQGSIVVISWAFEASLASRTKENFLFSQRRWSSWPPACTCCQRITKDLRIKRCATVGATWI